MRLEQAQLLIREAHFNCDNPLAKLDDATATIREGYINLIEYCRMVANSKLADSVKLSLLTDAVNDYKEEL